MKKHIPNTLTCCNLISGCIATYFAFQSNYSIAFAFIIIGAVFDFFDGFAARLLHVSSPVGKELDSLADDITFGFAPSAIVFSLTSGLLQRVEISQCELGIDSAVYYSVAQYLPYVAFLMAAFSALRLAKFNLDERQTTSFIGLPTPANALFWAALSVSFSATSFSDGSALLVGTALLAGVLISCWLLVAEIPMFALKFKHFGIHGNELRYGFILLSILLLIILGWAGFSAIIILYILTSIADNAFGTKVANKG